MDKLLSVMGETVDNHTGFYMQPYTDRLEIRYLEQGRPVSFVMLKWEQFEEMRSRQWLKFRIPSIWSHQTIRIPATMTNEPTDEVTK